ncbi:MAG: hypothetical protein ACFFDI_31695, partial [Promethearchaeota archaeon]
CIQSLEMFISDFRHSMHIAYWMKYKKYFRNLKISGAFLISISYEFFLFKDATIKTNITGR